MVLTHDKQRADYIVSISVIRVPVNAPPGIFGEASLSVAKRNGDVVLVENFYQDRKFSRRYRPTTHY
jgi:hypothetical protein